MANQRKRCDLLDRDFDYRCSTIENSSADMGGAIYTTNMLNIWESNLSPIAPRNRAVPSMR